ncbi:MAG: hypothetical protein NT025_02655 [bacterium]|nr:hypothetical protein [bacterium]
MRAPKTYKVHVPVVIFQEGEYFVAYCPVLELSSYGQSENEAKRAFAEALKIFIKETEKKGTLEKILLDLGWTLKRKPFVQYQLPEFSPERVKALVRAKRVVKETVRMPFVFA